MTNAIDKVKNRIETINKVHTYINENMPKLRQYYKDNGPVKITNKGHIFKHDKYALESLLSDKGKLQVWLHVSQYSNNDDVRLVVKSDYPVAEYGVNYYEASSMINNEDFVEFPLYDVDQWREEYNRLEGLRTEMNKLQSEIRRIEYITGGY